MKGYGAAFRIAITILLLAALVKPTQDRVAATAKPPSIDPDLLFFTSPKVIQKMALGYDGLLADVYWVRAIQYYGRREEAEKRPVRFGNLATLLNVTTELDPGSIDIYRFGSSFLSEPDPIGAGQPDEALKLLDRGIERHPGVWRLRYEKGFVYYWYIKDFQKAGEVWLETARVNGAPPWMEGLAAMAMSKGGALDTARMLWTRQYQESTRADIRDNARNHLFTIQSEEDRWTLEFLIARYRSRFGSAPRALQDLVRVGWLRGLPVDPTGAPYIYDPATGIVRLGPASGVRQLKLPFDYRPAFIEKLEKQFAGL